MSDNASPSVSHQRVGAKLSVFSNALSVGASERFRSDDLIPSLQLS